ncbi:MAG: SAM hydrolase/SAM-dependent halogenase family protein [Acidimicrobiia bacterium]
METESAIPVVSMLSDFGTTDETIGVCRAIVTSIAPEARIIDLTHGIAAHDIRAGALALVRAVQYLPTGIVLAAVDPLTNRRGIVVEVENGILIGPDNGLLAPAVAMLGGPTRVVTCTNTDYQLQSPGALLLARDVLAPAAGYLAAGTPLEKLGDVVDPMSLTPSLVPLPAEEGGTIHGEVWWINRFGDVQTNIDPDELHALGGAPGVMCEVRVGEQTRMARWVEHVTDGKSSELLLLVDPYGLCALAMDRASAAAALNVRTGAAIHITPPPTQGDTA